MLTQQHRKTPPMPRGVELWQADTNGEDLDAQNDPRHFLDYIIAPAPPSGLMVRSIITAQVPTGVRIKPIEGYWSKDDPGEQGQRWFREV